MCGIAGIISKNHSNIVDKLVRMLKNLEYRGYDSCGFAFIKNNEIIIKKSAGTINSFLKNYRIIETQNSDIGIAHTRWATHGNVNDKNAHPHTDCSRSIAVVHNGIIRNYYELREKLRNLGHKFSSDTDTEVIPHLLEEHLKSGISFMESLKKTFLELDGTFALVMITTKEPDKIFFARNGQPLILGISDKDYYIASDIPAFLEWTNRVIVLRDGDIGYIARNGIHVENLFGLDSPPKEEIVPWSPQQALKGEFPHFMIKEIFEQPDAIRRTIYTLPTQIRTVVDVLLSANNIIFVGAGSSFYSSLYGQYLFNTHGIKAFSVIASEFEHIVGPTLNNDDVVIAISQSGETFDTIQAIKIAKDNGATVIGLVNNMASTIRRISHKALVMGAGPEIGVVATKTFTTQITSLILLLGTYLTEIGQDYDHVLNQLEQIPQLLERYLQNIASKTRELSELLGKITNTYFLGRGLGVPIAYEGALKLKETAYVHAESYPAGESKHGPIALVENGFPVFNIVINDSTFNDIISNIEEMRSRGATTISITSHVTKKLMNVSDIILEVPPTHYELSAITYTIPLQLFAYYLAVKKGYNPDRPRNLAKSVTVA